MDLAFPPPARQPFCRRRFFSPPGAALPLKKIHNRPPPRGNLRLPFFLFLGFYSLLFLFFLALPQEKYSALFLEICIVVAVLLFLFGLYLQHFVGLGATRPFEKVKFELKGGKNRYKGYQNRNKGRVFAPHSERENATANRRVLFFFLGMEEVSLFLSQDWIHMLWRRQVGGGRGCFLPPNRGPPGSDSIASRVPRVSLQNTPKKLLFREL